MGSHDNTYDAIFSDPVRANIKWRDIESLLISLGAKLTEGKGSRVRVELGNLAMTFHRPHPRPDTDRGAVRSVRRLIRQFEEDLA